MSPRERDTYRRTAGQSWKVVPASGKKIAGALQLDASGVTRRKSGQAATYLSRLSEEAAGLERAGICTAFMLVHLQANAMMPQLRTQSRDQIEAELQALYLDEQQANGCFDMVQMRDLSDGMMATPVLRDELRRCAMDQAAKSTRIVALIDALEELDRGGVE